MITSKWEVANFVLQTRPLFETHTGANIAEVLKSAVSEWGLQKANRGIAVVTDNARNMDVAVREAGLAPPCQVFCTHFKLGQPSGFECATSEPFVGQNKAHCCLLSQKLQGHSRARGQTDTA